MTDDKLERMKLPNSCEHTTVQRYFKYRYLLDGDYIPANKKGSSVAYGFQHNKFISHILGYNICDDINFIYKDKLYFRYEITKIVKDNCLLCNGKLTSGKYYISCNSCHNSNSILRIGYSDYISPGKIIDRTYKNETYIFKTEHFELTANFEFNEILHRKCSREHIQRKLDKIICKIKLFDLIYRPKININENDLYYFDDIEYPENIQDIKNDHLCILGWKKLNYNSGRS